MTETTTTDKQYRSPRYFNLDEVPEAHRERIVALIPDPATADAYVNREVADGVTDFDAFDVAASLGRNVSMEGPTGAGKSFAALAWSAARGLPFLRVQMGGQLDAETLFGGISFDDQGDPFFMPGLLTLVAEYGGTIVFDESNTTHQQNTARLHGMLDDLRELEVREANRIVVLHPDVHMFTAYNPDYAGTVKLNPAFANRFAVKLDWGYDHAVEHVLIGQHSARLLTMMRNIRENTDITTDVGTNRGIEFIELAREAGIDFAVSCFVNGFREKERTGVRRSCEANAAAIATELGLLDNDADAETDTATTPGA